MDVYVPAFRLYGTSRIFLRECCVEKEDQSFITTTTASGNAASKYFKKDNKNNLLLSNLPYSFIMYTDKL